jgi:flavin-dependent dehydrogenase
MTEQSTKYDVVIVGGGPAGASAAIRLAQHGVYVLLVEQKKFPRAKLCGEFISPECLVHFDRLGVRQEMFQAGGAELTATNFYTRGGRSVSVPSRWFGAGSALGLSRAEMDFRLLERARAVGADVLEDTHAGNLAIENGHVRGVFINNGEAEPRLIQSTIAIDATGRSRALSRRLEKLEGNALRFGNRTRLVAFKAHLEGTRGETGVCEIYCYRGGYGGLNSVENSVANLCFIADARDVRACGGNAERVINEVVARNKRAAWTLGEARAVTPWLAVSLEGFGRNKLVPANGLLTIGDAASFIDPFTGSGMLMALESGELAAESIVRNLPGLKNNSFSVFAEEYRVAYQRRFTSRLRVCSMLRRAAFVPRLAETMIILLSTNERLRRSLARATRPASQNAEGAQAARLQ